MGFFKRNKIDYETIVQIPEDNKDARDIDDFDFQIRAIDSTVRDLVATKSELMQRKQESWKNLTDELGVETTKYARMSINKETGMLEGTFGK